MPLRPTETGGKPRAMTGGRNRRDWVEVGVRSKKTERSGNVDEAYIYVARISRHSTALRGGAHDAGNWLRVAEGGGASLTPHTRPFVGGPDCLVPVSLLISVLPDPGDAHSALIEHLPFGTTPVFGGIRGWRPPSPHCERFLLWTMLEQKTAMTSLR